MSPVLTKKRPIDCWLAAGVCVLSLCFAPGSVLADCSAFRGKVVINEVYSPQSNNGIPFVEIKLLDAAVRQNASFQNFKVSVIARYKSKGSTETGSSETLKVSESNSCGASSVWLTMPFPSDSTMNDKQLSALNVVLWEEASGGKKIIDIMRLGDSGAITSFYGAGTTYLACPEIEGALPASGSSNTQYDALIGSGQSVKDWFRTPDGTGNWGGTSNANKDNTTCGSNDGVSAVDSGKCAVADAGKLLLSLPNHAACSNQSLTVQACDSRFYSQRRDIRLYSSYVQPASGSKAAHLTYTGQGSTRTLSALSTSSSSPSTLTGLDFNADGIATLTMSYPDVGKLSLNASYAGSSQTGDSGLSMTGSTTFVAAPASFALTEIPSPLEAGKVYSMSVEARTATGNACASAQPAPNFGQEGETVSLSSWTRTEPPGNVAAAGPSDGVWTTAAVGAFTQGKATVSNISWSEVGRASVTVQVADGDYLGAGNALLGKTDVVLGPFRPAYLETALTAGCASFTYAGQPIRATVTAKNAAGVTTLNYGYLGGTGMAKAVTLSNAGSNTGVGNGAMPATTFSAGVGTYDSLTWTPTGLSSTLPVFTLRAVDADGVTSQGHAEGSTQVRQGRARLLNAYGSEILDLKVPLTVEYWNGTYWTRNAADTCTGNEALNAANAVRIKLDNGTLTAADTCVLDSGKPGLSNAGCSAAAPLSPVDKRYREGGVAGFAGDFNLWLQRPGVGKTGSVRVTAEVPDWLKYNWTGSLANPSANATFGVYRSGPVIHWREMY